MTRPRSSASGPRGPVRRRSLLPLLPLVASIAVGCIGNQTVPTAAPQATPTASAAATAAPSGTVAAPTATPTPSGTPTVEPSEVPTPTASDTPTGSPSGTSGSAERCTGSDDNRRFYAEATIDVAWAVYCPILPERWFVDVGNRGSAGGGWLTISYKGPSGARLELSEGAFCQDQDGCVPSGSDAGSAAFGDQVGTFVAGEDGGFSIVVDRGEQVSWLATGTGLEEDAFRDIVAGLNHIED